MARFQAFLLERPWHTGKFAGAADCGGLVAVVVAMQGDVEHARRDRVAQGGHAFTGQRQGSLGHAAIRDHRESGCQTMPLQRGEDVGLDRLIAGGGRVVEAEGQADHDAGGAEGAGPNSQPLM